MAWLETRRVYAAGSSLAITLPRGWLNYFGIKARDELEFEIVGNGDLVIRRIQAPEVKQMGEVRDGPEA
jgi:bifunctional DNA-binding transcriptional regulator/antitoxin component of YhaV-PrlF toxin-antitoxin module